MPSSLNFQVARMSSNFEAREVLEDAKKVSNEAQAKNSSDAIGKMFKSGEGNGLCWRWGFIII